MKDFILCVLLFVLIVAAGAAFNLWDQSHPCEFYSDRSVRNLPVRCLEYYR